MVFVCLWSEAALCQTTIYENTNNISEHPTIKNYKPDIDIKYEVWPIRRFDYVDRGTNALYTVEVSHLFITDFEIYKGYVYFCGSGAFSSKVDNFGAAFGYFNIDSVFFHNGVVHYCIFSNLNTSFNPQWISGEKLNDFTSTDIAVDRDALPHLIMTGQLSDENWSESVSFVADTWQTGGTWSFQYTADYSQTMTFCDVACTNETVIVAGIQKINTGNEEIFYIPFRQRLGADSSIFEIPVSNLPGSTIGFQKYFTSHLVVHPQINLKVCDLYDDGFAIVCLDTSINGGSYVASVYSSSNTNPIYRFVFGHSTDEPFGWVYNKKMRALCLVGWGAERYIYTIQDPYSSYDIVSTDITTAWLNVDEIHDTKQFVFPGSRTFREENIWVYDLTATESECVRVTREHTTALDKRQRVVYLEQQVNTATVEFNDEQVKIQSVPIETICR